MEDNLELVVEDIQELVVEDNQELVVEDIQVQVGNLELLKDILVLEDNRVLVGNLEIVLKQVDILGWVDNQWMEDTVVRCPFINQTS